MFHDLWDVVDSDILTRDISTNKIEDLSKIYYVEYIVLGNFEVRYKDLECDKSDVHKWLFGSVHFNHTHGDMSSISIIDAERDDEHEYYRDITRRTLLDKERAKKKE